MIYSLKIQAFFDLHNESLPIMFRVCSGDATPLGDTPASGRRRTSFLQHLQSQYSSIEGGLVRAGSRRNSYDIRAGTAAVPVAPEVCACLIWFLNIGPVPS